MPFDGIPAPSLPALKRQSWRARLAVWWRARAEARRIRLWLELDPRFARDVGLTSDEVRYGPWR